MQYIYFFPKQTLRSSREVFARTPFRKRVVGGRGESLLIFDSSLETAAAAASVEDDDNENRRRHHCYYTYYLPPALLQLHPPSL